MLAGKVTVQGHEAAEVLRPRSIRRAAQDNVTDLLGPKLLNLFRKRLIGVNLPLS